MRWRLAAAIAVLGIAGIPAVSNAMQAHPATAMHVAVKPRTGSPDSHFAVSFRAGVQTGPGSLIRSYRVTAGATKRNGCQSSATEPAPSAAQGAMVHVTLSPGKRSAWCTGTYQGRVWLYQSVRCGPPLADIACPQIEIRPEVVGTFTFRVTRG
ncbi:MAG: hypothetical protein WCD11_31180 [Solirubrobacteraceae bacterium]